MAHDPVVIASAARTPIGSFRGSLSGMTAPQLGAAAIGAAVERCGLLPDQVDQVVMGCVLPAGLGQAPARQAALGAGLAMSTPATTINKMCGSGMQAVILARQALLSGTAEVIVAGGMESMTNAPYLLPGHRAGGRVGHGRVVDHMYLDGLEDAYEPGVLMGVFAEEAAADHEIGREAQDAYAIESLRRTTDAIRAGAFAEEIVPVTTSAKTGPVSIALDEQPFSADPSKISALKPAFAPGGSITAASSSSISDGAAAMVLVRRSTAEARGLPILAQIAGVGAHADQPSRFAALPAVAMRKAVEAAGWDMGEVDLFEVNEAFAVVAMITMRQLGIDHARLNVNGGACALGHPIGASGARIIVTLLSALKARDLRRGVASLCIGGGEATSIAVEIAS